LVAKKEIAPELLAEAKRLYEQTLAPVDDIAGMVGLSRTNFYKRVRAGGWRGRRAKVGTFQFARALSGGGATLLAVPPAEQPRAEIAAPDDPKSPQQRLALAQRLLAVVEVEMAAIERIATAVKPLDQTEAEQGSRTIANVSRVTREIKELIQPENETPADDVDNDPMPRDIDEFRRELSRRLRGIIEARRARISERPDRLAADFEPG
jgi:hypothetical protein